MERAHEGRVSACLVHGGVVYTTSYDGSIKVRERGVATLPLAPGRLL